MKQLKRLVLTLCSIGIIIFICSCTKNSVPNDDQINGIIDDALSVAMEQYQQLANNTPDSVFPRTATEDQIKFVGIHDWTSGFFPASLWYLYEYSKDSSFMIEAQKYTNVLAPLQNYTGTHDLGFMVYCPYGKAYSLSEDENEKQVIVQASRSLISRFDSTIGLIKSWDSDYWQFPVIIDNMMNLEMLCEATKLSGDSIFYNIAVTHANTTLKNHFRKDNSTFHLVDYDTISGEAIKKQTVQGYSDSSAWARGQSWGLYGYTMMYRETGNSVFLNQARKIADFLIAHPNLPDDYIPFWDYNAPNIPNEPRDVAAAAIMASALIELDGYVTDSKYLMHAKYIVVSLASDQYMAKPGSNNNFILMHATGHLPANSEIDVPLNYADYYFIESLLRLKEKLN